MLRSTLAIIIPILCVFLQTVIQQIHIFANAPPSLILLSLMYFANQQSLLFSLILGLALGFLIDFLSVTPIGFFGLTYLIIGFAMGLIQRQIFREKIVPLIVIVIVFYMLRELLVIILSNIFQYSYILNINFLISLLITLCIAVLVFFINRMVYKLQPRSSGKEDAYEPQ